MQSNEPSPPLEGPGEEAPSETRAEPKRTPAGEGLRADLATHFDPRWSFFKKTRAFLFKGEIWLACLLRWGMWLRHECPAPLSWPLRLLWRPWFTLVRTILDTHISELGRIGPGFHISHHGGIWINENARLGAFCHVGPGVVIGAAGEISTTQFAPILGDRVWVGPHAVITGQVRVGNDCVIGSNSLVVADVPDNGVVVGVPARLVSRTGSSHLIPIPEGYATD